MRRGFARLAPVAVVVAVFSSARANPQGTAPRFERVPCAFPQPANYPRDLKRECGFLTVPEVRGKAGGRTFRLAVVVYHPPEPDGSPALVLLHGGPGGAGGTRFNWGDLSLPFARHRDVVTFDYRGVAESEPKLCPEFGEKARAAYARPTRQEWREGLRAAVRACVAQLDAQKYDRNAYGGDVLAHDALDLRRALGYTQWDLYGASYGGVVAQELMRLDPQGTRAVVLISTIVPGGNYSAAFTLASQHHLEHVFTACAAQPECARAFPELERDFYALHEEFSARPLTVVADSTANQRVRLDGDRFLQQMRRQMRQPEAISRVPLLIHELRRGDRSAAVRRLFDRGQIPTGDAIGSLIACNEYGARYPTYLAELKPKMKPPFQAIADDFLDEGCDLWVPNPTHQLNSSAVASDIPTLILDGEYDASRDAARTQQGIASKLTHAYAYTLPRETHAPQQVGCRATIIQSFLANPGRAPDTSCMARMPGMRFKTNSFAPTLTIVLNSLSKTPMPLAGTWEVTFGIGTDYTMQFDYDGSSLQGVVLENQLPLYDARIDATTLGFKAKLGTRIITFSGKLQGDSLMFTRDVDIGTSGPGQGLFGTIAFHTFTARRMQ